MGACVRLAQPPRLHPGVDLGRRDARVAEKLLDRAKVRAPLEQVGGERVAQGVGRDPPQRGDLLDPFAETPRHIGGGQAQPALGDEQGPFGAVVDEGGRARGRCGGRAAQARRAERSAPCSPCRARGRSPTRSQPRRCRDRRALSSAARRSRRARASPGRGTRAVCLRASNRAGSSCRHGRGRAVAARRCADSEAAPPGWRRSRRGGSGGRGGRAPRRACARRSSPRVRGRRASRRSPAGAGS